MFDLLKDKIYIRYWLAVVVSFLGDAMTLTTVLYLVGTKIENPLYIGLVFVAQLLPTVIIGPFVGPLIEKYSSRFVMVVSDVFRFIIVFCMFLNDQDPILLIGLVLFQGIGTAFFEPARMASIPTIVGLNRIPKAIALFQTTLAVIKLVGPVIAGVLLVFQSPMIIFLLDGVSYLFSALLILSLTLLKNEGDLEVQETSYMKSLWTGVLEMLNTTILLFMMIFLFPVMVAFGMFLTNFKAVMLQFFAISKIEFGIMEGMFAFGTVIGALIGSYLMSKMLHYRLLYVSIGMLGIGILCIYGVVIIDQLISQVLIALLIGWSLILGFTNALMMVPISSIFLQHVPQSIRGRGTAIFYSIFNLFLLLGTLIGGVVANKTGEVTTLLVSGGILLLTACSYPLYKNASLMKKVQKTVVSR